MEEHNGRRFSCCLTFDVDALTLWGTVFGAKGPTEFARGEFATVAVPRILKLLDAFGAQATFFVPGHTALTFPDMVRDIAIAGHEIGHHGWMHETALGPDREHEEHNLIRGIAAIEQVTGTRPRGFRAPAEFSDHTIELLLEHGFLYDSSFHGGNDTSAFRVRIGDRWIDDEPYRFGEPTELVEMPVYYGLDDYPLFEFVRGVTTGLSAPSAVEEIWRGDFDYAYRHVPGGFLNLMMHPEVIGRGHRLLMLERLMHHFSAHEGVVFESLGSYAERWKMAHV